MNLSKLFRGSRIFVNIPAFIHSLYLVILYSNNFWIHFVNISYFIISLIILIFIIISISFQFHNNELFNNDHENESQINSHKSLFFSFIAFLFTLSIIRLTRNEMKQRCNYLVSEYIQRNSYTYFIRLFQKNYSDSGAQDSFTFIRTIMVHDTQICVDIIWILLEIVFYIKFDEINSFISKETFQLPTITLSPPSKKSPIHKAEKHSFFQKKSNLADQMPLLGNHEEEEEYTQSQYILKNNLENSDSEQNFLPSNNLFQEEDERIKDGIQQDLLEEEE